MANTVKDLKFNELPEDIRENVIKAAKVIREKVNESIRSDDFKSIQNNEWGYDKVREFLVWFQNEVGTARVYKKGSSYSCMIQITGHVNHVDENPHCATFRKMIKRAYSRSRSECKKLGFTLTSEGECGDPFEGFDIWTTSAVAKDLWEKFPDKEEKKIHEIKEDAVVDIPPKVKDVNIDPEPVPDTQDGDKLSVGINELPKQLQEVVEHVNSRLRDYTEAAIKYFSQRYTFEGTDSLLNAIGGFTEEANCLGDTILWMENGYIGGSTLLTPPIRITSTEIDGLMESVATRFNEALEQVYPTKHVVLTGDESYVQFEMAYDTDYAKMLWKHLQTTPTYESAVVFPRRQLIQESSEYLFEPILEETETKEEKKDRMKAAKQVVTAATTAGIAAAAPGAVVATAIVGKAKRKSVITELMKQITSIQNLSEPDKSDLSMIEKTLSVVSKVFTESTLRRLPNGWKDLEIKLIQGKSKPIFSFKLPGELNSKDFSVRFIRGHETFQSFKRQDPTVRIQLNTQALATMKNPSYFYEVLIAAVQYYSKGIDDLATKIQGEFTKLPEEMKKVMSESNLYKLVGISLEQLVLFDNVNLSSPRQMFSIPNKSVKSLLVAIKALPKKTIESKEDKAQILKDFQEMFKSFYEYGAERISHPEFLESLEDLLNGSYDGKLKLYRESYHSEQINTNWAKESKDPQIKYYQEFFGVKKLKKIPSDLVAYISIETDAIRDANDKMMIASYCISKLEIVEWYIELLETGSKKYIVPHTLPWLNNVKTQLLACYDRIMRVKITPYGDRPVLGEIRYPKGYEG